MILLHDVRQLTDDQNSERLPDFCKTLFEEIYQVIDQQSAIIMFDLIKSINLNSLFSKKIE